VEESVLVLQGEASVEVGTALADVDAGEAVWVPAGTPHRFFNRGGAQMVIYWGYGGREVTRTLVATGETFEHLSDRDRNYS
jgi:mannose-6-phosphate isomerase-like protein (cupin superfamily)